MLILFALFCSLTEGIDLLPPRSDGRSDNAMFQEALNNTARVAIHDELGAGNVYYYFKPATANFNISSITFDACVCSDWISTLTTDYRSGSSTPAAELNETSRLLHVYWDCCVSEATCCYRECCEEGTKPFFPPVWNSDEEDSGNISALATNDTRPFKYKEPQRSTIEKIAVGVFLLVLIVPLYLIIRCLYWECIKKGKQAQNQPVIVEPQMPGTSGAPAPLSPRLPTVSVEGRSLEMRQTMHRLQPPSPSFSRSRSPFALDGSLSSIESASNRLGKESPSSISEKVSNENDNKNVQKKGLERFATRNS